MKRWVLTALGITMAWAWTASPAQACRYQAPSPYGHLRVLSKALEIYRLRHGELPSAEEGLGALTRVSENGPVLRRLPMDPWGQPYVYRPSGSERSEFRLYSMGPNRIDDQGHWDDLALGASGLPRPSDSSAYLLGFVAFVPVILTMLWIGLWFVLFLVSVVSASLRGRERAGGEDPAEHQGRVSLGSE